jgi:dihydroorotase
VAPYFDPERDADELAPDAAREFCAAANGIVGLETSLGLALALVHRSLIGPARLVEMMSLNPAALLRLDAGTLTTGGAADITVIDPNLEWTVEPARFLSKSRNTPFAGMRMRGKARLTIVAGEVVFDARKVER